MTKVVIDVSGRSPGERADKEGRAGGHGLGLSEIPVSKVVVKRFKEDGDLDPSTLDHVFHNKKHLVHETLSRVQESKRECKKKLLELQSLANRVEIGFQPALDLMVLEEERLLADIERRRMITEKLIRNEIEKRTEGVRQQARLLEQQMVSIVGCEEVGRGGGEGG